MRSKMKTTAFREIKGTFGRFAAILSIIMLGVGFFSGTNLTTPAMLETIGGFLNEHQFYDYRLVSTVGWDDEDIMAIASEDEVRYVEGANSADVLFTDSKDFDSDDTYEFVIKLHSMPGMINGLEVLNGRLPKNPGECVADKSSGLKVGDKIYVSPDNEDGTKDMLKFTELRVVGLVYSSLYIHWERGSTSLGNGSVRGFAYVMSEDFDRDFYSDIYVRFDQDLDLYSDEYKDFMEERKDLWKLLADEQAEVRYERLLADGRKKIDDGKKELEQAREDGQKKLDDAKKQLDDAKEQLDDAKEQLDDAKKEINDNSGKLKDAKKELDDGEKQLDNAKKELDNAKSRITAGEATLDASKTQLDNAQTQLDVGKEQLDAAGTRLDSSKQQLDDAAKQLADGEQKLNEGEQKIADAEKQIADGEKQIKDGEAEIEKNEKLIADSEKKLDDAEQQYVAKVYESLNRVLWMLNDEQKKKLLDRASTKPEEVVSTIMDYLTAEQQLQLRQGKQQIDDGKKEIEESKKKLADGKKEVEENKKLIAEKKEELNAAKAEYQKGLDQYNEGLAQYQKAIEEYSAGLSKYSDGVTQYNNGKQEYDAGVKQYNEGKALYEEKKQQFDEGKQQYEDGKKALEDGKKQYREGKQQYEEGLKKYEDGLKEYEDGKKELEEKLADAEKEIADAEKKLADIDEPEGYLLDRSTNVGYACFENDSAIVQQVASVFPVFFVLVAALVCMTTMSRMVEEQRTQIGMFKALGYSEKSIMGKFMFYSGAAATIGCIIGYIAGTLTFPAIIWMTYKLMYLPLDIDYVFNPWLALLSLAASLICSVGMTWISCRHELEETAAQLMRPKAPKAGKRVLLERIPFIWKHMKFLHKVSVRNIFRYKRRLFMMIVGISGCTALLLTGFGINDSVKGFGDVQFDEILIADADMRYKPENGKLPSDLKEKFEKHTEGYALARAMSWNLIYGEDDREKEMDVYAPENYETMTDFFLFNTKEGKALPAPKKGEAIVSYSLQERYGVNVGDRIVLRDDKLREMRLTVTGVFNNYLYNYIFISPETLESKFGEKVEYNFAFLNFNEGENEEEASADITSCPSVQYFNLFSVVRTRMRDTMSSLNYVVLLIIICAAGLAFVVIYNLTNINITERLREIATIKVLGFFRRETSAYVLRENIALTAMGIVVGLGLGILLHSFVMAHIRVDMVTFKARILPMSYVYSIVLTFVFNFIVNIFMEIKLDRINMAESLKSVD